MPTIDLSNIGEFNDLTIEELALLMKEEGLGNLTERELEAMYSEAHKEALRRQAILQEKHKFSHYSQDPLSFCESILGEHFYEDTIQVMESVRDYPVTIARSATGVGKTFTAARLAIWWYLVYPESQTYVTAAPPLENLINLLWGEIMSCYREHEDTLFSEGHKQKLLKIERRDDNLSFITGVTIPLSGTPEQREAKFSGKHAPQLLFIVDEGDAVPDEVYKGIDGCMSGGLARLLIMFNPRQQIGPVYNMEVAEEANVIELSAFRHPNVVTGIDLIPGAVTREATIRRLNEWSRPLVEDEPTQEETYTVPDFLVGEVGVSKSGKPYDPLSSGERVVEDPSLPYKVLGRYPSQAVNQLIAESWIMAAVERWKEYVKLHGETPPTHRKIIEEDGSSREVSVYRRQGVDVAEFGPDANVSIIRHDDFVEKPALWRGVDPIITGDKALDIHLLRKCDISFVDGTGYGSAVAPYMIRKAREQNGISIRAITVKVAGKPSISIKTEMGEFYQLRDQLWWAVREWLRDKNSQAMLPPNGWLIEELKTPTYEFDNRTRRIKVMAKDKFRDKLKRSPNFADALTLTFVPNIKNKVMRISG